MSEYERRSMDDKYLMYRRDCRYFARELARIRDAKELTADELREMAADALHNKRNSLK